MEVIYIPKRSGALGDIDDLQVIEVSTLSEALALHASSAVDGYSLSQSFDVPAALNVAQAEAVFAATNFATINALPEEH